MERRSVVELPMKHHIFLILELELKWLAVVN
jgi:hypothetical protein